ncbi:hypothetical protein RZE82_02160 [Mollicutes bacterium LVI A0039]|nr:hypothetical protein RZE82_02160 [Mollicutes bacterium LVI A0039]
MNLTEYLPDYLNADNPMLIDVDRNNIIFGANGIGKSSIYKELIKNEEYHYIDYNDMLNDFKKSKKKVEIAANIVEIESINNSIEDKVKNKLIKKSLKKWDITTQGQCFTELLPIFKSGQIQRMLTATIEDFEKLNSFYGELGTKFYPIIKSILDNAEVIEIREEIQKLKKDFQKKLLTSGDSLLLDDSTTCPFCDSEVENIKALIRTKIEELDIVEGYIIESFKDTAVHENRAREITEEIENMSNDVVIDYLITGGEYEQLENVNELVSDLIQLNERKEFLFAGQVQMYEILKGYEVDLENDVKNKVDDVNIRFNDTSKCIELNFSRNVETYSNGELNYILFNVKLYEFIGSDKTKLIIDDILTSYDEINQYSLIYLLVKQFAGVSSKKFICFTHNFNTLKIIDNQHPGFCDMYIMDKYNNNNMLFEFNYHKFEKAIKFEETDTFSCGYIKMLNDRVQGEDDERHKIFHFDGEFSIGAFSNLHLVSLISDFVDWPEVDSFDYTSFKEFFEYKVRMFLALRVYIEYVIYKNISDDQKVQINGKTLGKKIDCIFPRGVENTICGLNRSLLMSKKVMLNDFVHIENRVNMPFQYILNIKTEDLLNEIRQVKELVESN